MKKFINWLLSIFDPYSVIVNEADYNMLKADNVTLRESRDRWQKLSDENLKSWGESINSMETVIKTSTDLQELCQQIYDSKQEVMRLCRNQQDLIHLYSNDYSSLARTVDSLVGELIMLGKTEEEIEEMFDKELSYSYFLREFYKNNRYKTEK